MDVRDVNDTDLDLLIGSWPLPGSVHESHHAQTAHGIATPLAAWEGAEPLGSGVIQWSGCVDENARRTFPQAVEFNHLHVHEGARGRGVGTELIGVAEDLARRRGVPMIAVGVAEDNRDARRLYLKLDYRATGMVDVSVCDWVGDDGEPAHTLEANEILVKEL